MKARECQITPPLTDKNHSTVGWGLKFDFWADNNATLCAWTVDMPPMGGDATDHTHISRSLTWPHPILQEREGVW